MLVKRKILYIVSSIIFILVLACLGLYYLFFLVKSDIKCDTFNDRYFSSDCGVVKELTTEQAYGILGIITKKYIQDNNYYITLDFKDKTDRLITKDIALGPYGLPLSQTKLLRSEQILQEGKIESVEKTSGEILFNSLAPNEQVVVLIPTPEKDIVDKAKSKYGNIPPLNCIDYNNALLTYINNPSPFAMIKFKLQDATTKCKLHTLQVFKR